MSDRRTRTTPSVRSFDEMIPAGALDREALTGLVAAPCEPEHERVLRCTECGTVLLVCGHVDDLDPDTYRGVFCCWVDQPEDWR